MFKKRQDYLVFGSPLIEEPEIQEVVDTLESAWLGTGPEVAKFGEIFKEYKCKGAIGISVPSRMLGMERQQI
jgi:dTDP-4-amino-4,6-dideoxygalactose transaminase